MPYYEGSWDSEQVQPILAATEEWAHGHPKKAEPFLVLMGRSFTPLQFYDEVRDGTQFARSFVGFLIEQSRRYETLPQQFIYRAISNPPLR